MLRVPVLVRACDAVSSDLRFSTRWISSSKSIAASRTVFCQRSLCRTWPLIPSTTKTVNLVSLAIVLVADAGSKGDKAAKMRRLVLTSRMRLLRRKYGHSTIDEPIGRTI